MADNVELDPGTGGAVIATDDISSVHYQYVKLASGTDQSTTVIPAGGGTEAAALRVTVATDSTGVLSVDDNGSSLTIDNAQLSVVGSGTEAAALRVTVASDSTGVLSVDDNGGNLSIDDGGNSITVDNTVISVVGGGTEATAQRVTIASDSTGVLSVDDNGASLTVDNGGTFAVQDSQKVADDAAFTVGTTPVQPAGFFADQASTDSVNEGDVGAARMTLDRKQIVTVAPSADTEGLTIFRSLDLDETEEEIKATAGKVYGWYLYNDGAAEVYVKFYNATAANVTVGSTTPVLTIPVPAGAAANVEYTNGITFGTAITAAATTAVADADTAAPAANQVIANVFYQ